MSESFAKTVELKYTDEQIQACIAMLDDLVKNSHQLAHLSKEQTIALITAAGQLSRPARDEIRKRKRDLTRVKKQRVERSERKLRAATGIRSARESAVFTAPMQITNQNTMQRRDILDLKNPRYCYVCKVQFTQLHHFYASGA